MRQSVRTSAASGRRVLVTGGSGFVGRHLVSVLLDDGYDVTVVDRRPCPEAGLVNVTGDLCDERLRDHVVSSGFDAIVHLAAATSVLGSIERPAEVHRTNVTMTAGLLEAARRHGSSTFVLASSNAVTGNVGSSTITEDTPLRPLTPYGATKAAAEMLVSGYAGSYGLRAPVLRFTNIYGGGMGHKDSFVPRLLRAAASGDEVQIYGDGEQRRDLVHVTDVIAAIVAAVRDWPSGPVIIGGSCSYTVNEITDTARAATGLPIRTRQVPAKQGEMPAVIVDVSRARTLGYEPRMSLLRGLQGAWRDFAPTANPQA